MILVYILASILYLSSVTFFLKFACEKFYKHKLITPGERKLKPAAWKKTLSFFLINSTILGVILYIVRIFYEKGMTNIYVSESFDLKELLLILFQVFIMMFLFDTVFYWAHRLFHWKKIFRYVHKDHHFHHFPNTWNTWFADPVDGLLAIFLPMLWVVFLPFKINLISYIAIVLIANFENVAGHCGHEVTRTLLGLPMLNSWASYIDPKRKWIARFFNTVVHHDLHHQKFRFNYSLYFTLWDVLGGTTYPETDKVIEASDLARP